MQEHENAQALIRRAGLRCTAGRLAIIEVLGASVKPLTRKQIADALGQTSLDKVTIYRALERFVERGVAHKACTQDRTAYFELADKCTEHQCHPHFTCTSCGSVSCFTHISLPLLKSPQNGFTIERQRVHLEGLCPKCTF